MTAWELKLAAGMLGGVVIVTPRDLNHLRRLEQEAPRLHAHVMDLLLACDPCDVDLELTGLMWKLDNWWARPAWGGHRRRFERLPGWFREAYDDL